jgi:hypothetical protein
MVVHQDDVLLALQSNLIAACHNWRQTRSYAPSLTKRSEGWTEKWGDASVQEENDCWKTEQEAAGQICATAHPLVPVTLFQYRPAWIEQLALGVANVPFTVVNTTHAVTEVTGPLPYIRELQPNLAPVLTGRGHMDGSPGNAILQYLSQQRGIDLDEPLHNGSKELEGLSKLFANLIENKLQNSLFSLRYQDWEAWDQIYRPQCLQAASGTSTTTTALRWLRFPGWWQAWSERVHMLSMLSHDTQSMTIEQAVQQARDAYQVLEAQLEHHQPGPAGQLYLLGTAKPVTADLLLWDHLMQALMDVHLVVVLADFPVLCRYVQRIWDKYFVVADAAGTDDRSPEEWKEWNALENARNAFAQLPLLQPPKKDESHTFREAVELMEQLSVRAHDLQESVALAKEVRGREEQLRSKHVPFYTWHRWRMGDDLYPTPAVKPKQPDATSDREEEMKKEFRRNDEAWVTGVGVVTALTAAMFLVASSQGGE